MMQIFKPLIIKLPLEKFLAVTSGEKDFLSSKRTKYKDRFFSAYSPEKASIYAIGSSLSIVREITNIRKTPTEWRVYF